MGVATYHLTVLAPDATQPAKVTLTRLRDDGRAIQREPIGDEGMTLTIAEPWVTASSSARATPRRLDGALVQQLHAIGEHLFAALPEPVRTEFDRLIENDERVLLIVTATGNAAALPWELLAKPVPKGLDAEQLAQPAASGRWQIIRRTADTDETDTRPVVVVPRTLVVLLDSRQEPGRRDARHSTQHIAKAVRDTGWTMRLVTCSNRLATPGVELLDGPTDLCKEICAWKPTLIHFVGHSDQFTVPIEPVAAEEEPTTPSSQTDAQSGETAGDPAKTTAQSAQTIALPGGATRLYVSPTEELTAPDLAAALHDAKSVRAVITQACDTRETLAEAILRNGGVEHLITTGAIVDPDSCRVWAERFYQQLAVTRSIAKALRDAGDRLQNDPHHRLLWPFVLWWSRSREDLEFADDEQRRIERYCRCVARRVDRIEHVLGSKLHGVRMSDLYVELRASPDSDGGADFDERDRALLDLTDGKRQVFGVSTLPRFAHNRRFLLGGPPGSGKSTTLRMVAREVAEDRSRARLPVFVSLARWLGTAPTSPPSVFEAAVADLVFNKADREDLVKLLETRAEQGGVCFFFDGFDELSGPARSRFLDLLAQFADRGGIYETSQFIVSTRRYSHTKKIGGFVDVDLRGLSPADAEQLLLRVLRAARPAERAHDPESVARTWRRRFEDPIRERMWHSLGQVPLFVTLIGVLLAGGRSVARSRFAFFRQVFDHLCRSGHRGDQAGHGQHRPLVSVTTRDERLPQEVDDVLDLLGDLALWMTRDTVIERTRQQIEAWLADRKRLPAVMRLVNDLGLRDPGASTAARDAPGQFLDALAERTLLLGPDDVLPDQAPGDDRQAERDAAVLWRFWHRSFQEALAAHALLRLYRARVVRERKLLWRMLARGAALLSCGRARVPGLLRTVRIKPTGDEVEAEELGLQERWRASRDDPADRGETFFGEFQERFETWSEADRIAVNRHITPRGWSPAVVDAAARAEARPAAVRKLLEFWIESLALVLSDLVDQPAVAVNTDEPSANRAAALLQQIRAIHPDLARQVALKLDRCPLAVWRVAIEALPYGDKAVAEATTRGDLNQRTTRRLADRLPVYTALWAAACLLDAEGFAGELVARAAGVDDPGELFLIDLVGQRMARSPHAEQGARVVAAVERRLGAHVPDARAWAAHFVEIPGSEYLRGSDAGGSQNRERPPHRVRVRGYWMGRTPVTVALFRQFWPTHRMAIEDGDVRTLDDWRGASAGPGEAWDDLPVTYVSWFAAMLCSRWLELHWPSIAAVEPRLVGLAPRLPLESQAEYAIRGGTVGEHWFGTEAAADAAAWFDQNAGGRPHAVAGKRSNAFGLFDIVGNVTWWCEDAYDASAYAAHAGAAEAPLDPREVGPGAASRVVRGGSFDDSVLGLRSAYRSGSLPASADWGLGFRVALVAAPPELGSAIDDR